MNHCQSSLRVTRVSSPLRQGRGRRQFARAFSGFLSDDARAGTRRPFSEVARYPSIGSKRFSSAGHYRWQIIFALKMQVENLLRLSKASSGKQPRYPDVSPRQRPMVDLFPKFPE
jgi:hypothetical protein